MKTRKLFIFLSLITFAILQFFFISCDKVDEIINPETGGAGDTIWVHHIPQGENASISEGHLARGIDGTIYYAGIGNSNPVQIYAVNKSDGSLKWRSAGLQTWYVNSNIVVADDGSIYVASYTKLYSINPNDGSFNWVWEVPETLPLNGNNAYSYGELGAIALAGNGNIIIKTTGGGSYYRALYGISSSGAMEWFRFIGSESTPITIGYDGTIYDFEHNESGGVFTATSPDNGDLIWSMPAYASSSYNNITIAGNGDIIAFIYTDTLIRISPSNHQAIWKRNAATSQDNILFDSEGNLYLYDQWAGTSVYNISDGSQKSTGVGLPHNPVIDTKTQFYGVLSDNNPVMSITDNEGNVNWETKTGVYGHSALLSDDENVVYCVVSGGKEIYALKTDASLPHTGWPRYTHDNRNTFNVNKW